MGRAGSRRCLNTKNFRELLSKKVLKEKYENRIGDKIFKFT
jgi:hypothetical protein